MIRLDLSSEDIDRLIEEEAAEANAVSAEALAALAAAEERFARYEAAMAAFRKRHAAELAEIEALLLP